MRPICCPVRTHHDTLRVAKWGYGIVTIGAILAGVFIFLAFFIRHGIREGIRNSEVLTDMNSQYFRGWANNTQNPVVLRVYVYDIVNADEVLGDGAKPVMRELGPFVYRNLKERYDFVFSDDDELLSFKTFDRYAFDEEASVAPDSTTFRTVNLPFVGIMANVYGTGPGNLIAEIYQDETSDPKDIIFSVRSVRDIVFGYTDSILQTLHLLDPAVDPKFPGIIRNMSSKADAYPADTVYTGKSPDNFRQYYAYRGQSVAMACYPPPPPCPGLEQPIWRTVNASRVGGSDGSQTTPNVVAGSSFYLWRADAYRQVRYVNAYQRRSSYKGIRTFVFVMDDSELLNSTQNPANSDYYQNEINGFFNVSRAADNVGLFLSKPHFLGVDKHIRDSVSIVYKSNDLREATVFEVEPISGATMHVLTRSQFNFFIQPLANMPGPNNTFVTWFEKLQPTYTPVLWLEEEDGINDHDASRFRDQVYGAEDLANLCFYAGLPVAGAIFVWGIICVFYAQNRHNKISHDHDHDHHAAKAGLMSSSDGSSIARSGAAASFESYGALGDSVSPRQPQPHQRRRLSSKNPTPHAGDDEAIDISYD